MARKKKQKSGEELPAWLVTFSDMMTLLLTFFVMLNSMAVIDERRKLVAIGSIIGTFGEGTKSYDVTTKKDTKRTVEPGPMEDIGDLEPVKERIWDDYSEDLSFAESRFVQIISISADVLFESGETVLSAQGNKLLESISPELGKVEWPVLVAGHTSTLRDELGEAYKPGSTQALLDPSWRISLGRTLAVYRRLLELGVPSDKLRTEAFGRYHPRFPSELPEGRRMNRRVDLVLDKRNTDSRDAVSSAAEEARSVDEYRVGGFVFRVTGPNGNATEGR